MLFKLDCRPNDLVILDVELDVELNTSASVYILDRAKEKLRSDVLSAFLGKLSKEIQELDSHLNKLLYVRH